MFSTKVMCDEKKVVDDFTKYRRTNANKIFLRQWIKDYKERNPDYDAKNSGGVQLIDGEKICFPACFIQRINNHYFLSYEFLLHVVSFFDPYVGAIIQDNRVLFEENNLKRIIEAEKQNINSSSIKCEEPESKNVITNYMKPIKKEKN
ncbi:hypothetical protein WA158_004340 [Blastocystis sp. Blastoise]